MSKRKVVRHRTDKATTQARKQATKANTPLTLVQADAPQQPGSVRPEEPPTPEPFEETDEVFEPLTPAEEDQLDDLLDEMIEQNGHVREAPSGGEYYSRAEPRPDSLTLPETMGATPSATLGAESSSRVPDITPAGASPKSVEPAGILIAHCGTRKITREELALIPVPEATRTHQPLAHHRIVEALVESLAFRHIAVVREEYAMSPDGARMFGVLDLNTEWSGVRFAIGLRNSNDKSMRLGLTVGYRVTVCDNMMFAGDFAPVFHKHTRRLDLLDVISIGVDKMQRGFAPLKAQIDEWQQQPLSDDAARLIIYRAFLEDRFPRTIMAEVHKCYFEPLHEEFRPRTLWSLSNAFTSAFKELKPVRQFTATAKLGVYLEGRQCQQSG